jgi:cytidylate kinase
LSTLIVTVDGPGGTGKSSVSREVARRLGLPYLDTGAFYRAATLAAMRAGVHPADAASVAAVVAGSGFDQESGRMFLDGEDVSDEIRGQAVEDLVSQVAANPEVRRLLVEHQRAWADRHDHRAVIEGRDIGSVVFPDAEVKVYLDARPEVRARRRALQSGTAPEAVHTDLQRRDHIDSSREASPLTVPAGAEVVDTSDLHFDEVVQRVVRLVAARSS